MTPLTPASRQRLQKVFEHAQRSADKDDFEYATQLFTQCVVEDPGNVIYLQKFFANLQKKFKDNKTGARLAGFKIKSHRSALIKATSKGNWTEALTAGCSGIGTQSLGYPDAAGHGRSL